MTIRRAEQTDFRNLCITAMRAFADDPVMRWLYPDNDDYFLPNGAVFANSMTNWLANQQPLCTDDAAALAIWFPPVEPGTPEPELINTGPPLSEDRLARFALIGPVMAANKPAEPYWYLQLLATHPDWQRSGLGAQLMQVVFEQADDPNLLPTTEGLASTCAASGSSILRQPSVRSARRCGACTAQRPDPSFGRWVFRKRG
jgi:GNAT superfamily N-acetyltransferase